MSGDAGLSVLFGISSFSCLGTARPAVLRRAVVRWRCFCLPILRMALLGSSGWACGGRRALSTRCLSLSHRRGAGAPRRAIEHQYGRGLQGSPTSGQPTGRRRYRVRRGGHTCTAVVRARTRQRNRRRGLRTNARESHAKPGGLGSGVWAVVERRPWGGYADCGPRPMLSLLRCP